MRFTPWNDEVEAAVSDAFGEPSHWTERQGRTHWRVSTGGARWSRCIVGFDDDGSPVVVASAFLPRLHNGRAWCYVEVAPPHRRTGVATAALTNLRRRLPAAAPSLRGKVADRPGPLRFADAHGFRSIQRNRTLEVLVPQVSATEQRRALHRTEIDDEVVSAWWRFYENGHEWDPPGETTPPEVRELFFGDQSTVITHEAGGVVDGIALLYDGEGAITFVGGAVERDADDAEHVATELLHTAADRLDSRRLVIELDDWMWEVEWAVRSWSPTIIDTAFIVAEP